ncbi:MAG: tRNA (guanosine(37)-N1)-methyltransferase TrmD [Lutispora sp.]
MRFDVVTLFPEMFEAVLGGSIIGRARKNGAVDLNFHNLRDYSQDKHKRVDDYPYGGGLGMVMQCQPIFSAVEEITKMLDVKPHVILMSPKGKTFSQNKAKELLQHDNVIIICGHYEGIDERVVQSIVDEEISIGDFILTGGEIAAMAIVDAISRLLPGVLKEEDSHNIESFSNGLLEYPQYTRPVDYRGMKVPDILLSGHHENIEKWRNYYSLKETYLKRPDLLDILDLTKEEKQILNRIIEEEK